MKKAVGFMKKALGFMKKALGFMKKAVGFSRAWGLGFPGFGLKLLESGPMPGPCRTSLFGTIHWQTSRVEDFGVIFSSSCIRTIR